MYSGFRVHTDEEVRKYFMQEDEPTGEDKPVEPEDKDDDDDEGNESDTDEEVV